MNNKLPFTGLHTALITPFKNDSIDWTSFEKIIEYQIENGVDGLVFCGTTGESSTLSHEEHNLIIERGVRIVNSRVKVIAGTGSNSTNESIKLTRHAQKSGVDAALIITPYYNKPTQNGMYNHFKAIHDSCSLPIILYNVPGRTCVNLSDETIIKLSELKNVIGLKDATGDLARVYTLKATLQQPFTLLSGEDMTAVSFNASGGNGIISVTSNLLPKICSNIQKLSLQGNIYEANIFQQTLTNINSILFKETNPIPIKYIMHLAKFCENEIRMPLCQPSEELKIELTRELKKWLNQIQ